MEDKLKIGLTSKEVEERKQKNLVTVDTTLPTKSVKQIIKENFITLFNILNLILGICIFAVGSYKNMLFLWIVIVNTAISTVQEIHSKRMIDKLAILATQKAKVIRDGKKQEIEIHEIVLEDIIELEMGNQVAVDSVVQEGTVEVDESFLTGEPDSIYKQKGDMILSGSIVLSGRCQAKVVHVGEENFASKMTNGVKHVKKVKSEMMQSLSKIIETLARVDTLCLDKTGTLTEGKMEVKKYSSLNEKNMEMENILANFANNSQDSNATMVAIKEKFKKQKEIWKPKTIISFSSQTKWSAITFEEKGSYLLGAPEIIMKRKFRTI